MSSKEYDEFYDLKYHIAQYIFPKLDFFCNQIREGKNQSVPQNLSDSFEEASLKWAEIIDKIKVPFEYLITPDKYKNYSFEEIEQMRNDGLKLFAEYFDSLWD